jgi:hypothetical protein
MLTPQGQLKLIDFGIARFFKAGKPGDTLVMGTPGYAAPEQHGQGQTDARSDVYSLGVLLHHLLTGYDPAATPFALPPVRQLNPQVSPAMAQVITRAIEVHPAQRFPTVDALCQALASGTAGLAAGQARRMGVVVGLAAVALVALLAVLLLRSQTSSPPTAGPAAEATAGEAVVMTLATATPAAPGCWHCTGRTDHCCCASSNGDANSTRPHPRRRPSQQLRPWQRQRRPHRWA